jgi:hypothetical protein
MPVVARRAPPQQPNRISAVLPQVPIAEFARLKEVSPAKKPKMEETVLHTVDIKGVKFVLFFRFMDETLITT